MYEAIHSVAMSLVATMPLLWVLDQEGEIGVGYNSFNQNTTRITV